MRDLGLLIIRVVVGGLLLGHGSQKLFGWFGGYGLQGTGSWLESIGIGPGRPWATLAGLGEFGGGLLTALGFFHPIGPIVTLAPMAVATGTVHAGKPIWAAEGGAELPATYMAAGIGLALAGPGRYSLDRLLGIKTPTVVAGTIGAGAAVLAAVAITRWRAARLQKATTPTQQAAEGGEEEPHSGEIAVA